MWVKVSLVLALASLCCYLYGILFAIINTKPNLCKMTYMFEYPQFVKIQFDGSSNYPKYNLYAYAEGRHTENARNMRFNGAPVIFVPGNSGSYKQARSFASVALRKGIDNNWIPHLDYFTVDYNEEYTALFGGYLDEQTQYLAECIKAILNLYKTLSNPPKQVILIGHSMGGKIAQSVVTLDNTSDMVNTIIVLATPIDRPVLNIDLYFEAFYQKTNLYWEQYRTINLITNVTNTCSSNYGCTKLQQTRESNSNSLDKLLLITIGGGSRDLLVQSGLTSSKFSDINAMSTSIPNVWLSTDHLCSVWCLQQVMVVNRFLYSIISPIQNAKTNGQSFIIDKEKQLHLAKQYLTQEKCQQKSKLVNIINESSKDLGEWIEDSRRVYSEFFSSGIKRPKFMMIRLIDLPQSEILSVETISLDADDWVFGCSANQVSNNMRYCSKGTSLSHLIKKIPSQHYDRRYLHINLHNLLKENPTWTHVILRILPTTKPVQLNIDIHNANDRRITTTIPKWYSTSTMELLADTMLGSVSYTIDITGLSEPFKGLELTVKQRSCSKPEHHALAKICVPWADGFERFHYFTDKNNTPMSIYVPIPKPVGYNTTINPVSIDLILDPNCRYSISIKNAFGMTISRIVLQFSQWIPAHLVAIVLLAMKHQISLTPPKETFKCGNLHSALYKSSSFFIVTATKVFVKLVLWMKFLPPPDAYDHSLLISVLIHGSALALLTLATSGAWIGICFCGNVAYKIIIRIIKLPIPTLSNAVLPLIEKFPMGVCMMLISIGAGSCGGLAILCAAVIYFALITKRYEDYLEEFIYKTAQLIASKLFCKNSSENNADEPTESAQAVADNLKENDVIDSKIEELSVNTLTNKAEMETSTELAEKIDDQGELERLVQDGEEVKGKEVQEAALSEEEKASSEELDRLLKESLLLQQKTQLQRTEEMANQRIEYDSIHEALSAINFHISMFLLLVILVLLNLPSVITWAKNYHYSSSLKSDPSFFASVATLTALSFLWQLKTPRNIQGYQTIASILYLLACVCILYCQDSVYRLNAVISTVFVLIALHQVLAPDYKPPATDPRLNIDADLASRIELLKEELNTPSMTPDDAAAATSNK